MLAPRLEVDGVSPLDGTFVDDDLTQRQTDVVLQARLAGREVIIYVLIEHQSSVDPLMAVRLHRYQSRIWDRYIRAHPGTTTAPLILPAVVYHGSRPWTAPTDLGEVLGLDAETVAELGNRVPRMLYDVDDLTQIDLAALRERSLPTPLLVPLALLMQVARSPDLLGFLETLADDFTKLAAGRHGQRHLSAAFTYIVSVSNISTEQLRPFAHRLGPVVQEALMTTAEKLRAEGRAQGRAEGQAEFLMELLIMKFGPQPVNIRARVFTATSDQLHAWTRRILPATTIDEVLD